MSARWYTRRWDAAEPEKHIFGIIAEASAGPDAQLVLSLRGGRPEEMEELAGERTVGEFALAA